jgi:agmatine deiminase
MTRWRMPAEWERHDATWIAWPHHEPDWPGKLEAVRWAYVEIARVLAEHERVDILCQTEESRDSAVAMLRSHEVAMQRVNLIQVRTDRVWLRDSGPSFVWNANGEVEMIAWDFNAWAKYENCTHDRLVPDAIQRATGLPLTRAMRPDNAQDRLVLEGGGIDVNGQGRVLVTEEWLLSDVQVRNPGLTRAGYEAAFEKYLGCGDTIWLGSGCAGDDTHGHVDDVARFVNFDTVVLAYEADPSDANHASSLDNLERLRAAAMRQPLNVILLPYPRVVMMDGQRLPASYANFYIANGVVLVPTFNDPNDRVALDIIAGAFPGRSIVGIHAVDLVWGLGTLHCLTQQQPAMALDTRIT